MEYNIPTIQMDVRKTYAASKRECNKVNINKMLTKTTSAIKKRKPVPEAKIKVSKMIVNNFVAFSSSNYIY